MGPKGANKSAAASLQVDGHPRINLRTGGKAANTREITDRRAFQTRAGVGRGRRGIPMAPETLAKTALARTLADVLGDFSDLIAKQIQLARAEITANISSGILASTWLGLAALLFLLAVVLVIEAAVFGIANTGIALHWACLMVAAVLAGVGGATLVYARSVARDTLTPARSIRQMNKDISAAKEHLV
jgi:Putative Actinobacterial Holin-X, holin superfamily III